MNSRRLVGGALLLLNMAGVLTANEQSTRNPIRDLTTHVRIGMTIDEFLIANPNANKRDSASQHEIYVASTTIDALPQGAFSFDKGRLVRVAFRRSFKTLSDVNKERASYLQWAKDAWGDRFELFARIQGHPTRARHELPVLVWPNPSVTRALIASPACEADGKTEFGRGDAMAALALFYVDVVVFSSTLDRREALRAIDLIKPDGPRPSCWVSA